MKSYTEKAKSNMPKYIFTKPFKVSDFNFEDLESYDDSLVGSMWQEKARRLQARRWRKIKHQLV
ncbi:MAG TPA: hypothetical protein VJJ78_02815 [Candidatus Saccharimonadales bacterium]|nr:hypothetical protein [Candidatus Saccharimonadales bacterium]